MLDRTCILFGVMKMRNYYIGYSNGDCDFIEAKTDNSAYSKSCKMAKELCTKVNYLAEVQLDQDGEIIGEDKVIIKNGKEV